MERVITLPTSGSVTLTSQAAAENLLEQVQAAVQAFKDAVIPPHTLVYFDTTSESEPRRYGITVSRQEAGPLARRFDEGHVVARFFYKQALSELGWAQRRDIHIATEGII